MINRNVLKEIDEVKKLLGFASANIEHALEQPEERVDSENIALDQLERANFLIKKILGNIEIG